MENKRVQHVGRDHENERLGALEPRAKGVFTACVEHRITGGNGQHNEVKLMCYVARVVRPPITPRPEPPRWEEEDVRPERANIQVRLSEGGGELAETSEPETLGNCLCGHPSSFDPLSSPRQHKTNRPSRRGPIGGLTERPLLEESCSTRLLSPL
jgi:hypothetical protein